MTPGEAKRWLEECRYTGRVPQNHARRALQTIANMDTETITTQPHLRLPSFSGHPISTDLVSVGEDVHCEFVKEEVHPGVPA